MEAASAEGIVDKYIAASEAERGYFPSLLLSTQVASSSSGYCIPMYCVSYDRQKVIATTLLSFVPFEYF